MFNPMFGGEVITSVAEQLIREGFDQGHSLGVNKGITKGTHLAIQQAKQYWQQSNDEVVNVMKAQGLPKESIDIIAKLNQERLSSLSENVTSISI